MLKRCCLLLALLLSFPALSQDRKTSQPYTGDLTIFDTPGRAERLQIDRVMDLLDIGPGKKVADIGAGSGWFTVIAARRVQDQGHIYAVDINPEALRYIDDRVKKENLTNVSTILGSEDDPKLQDKVDAVLILKTYHEIAQPIPLLRNLRSSLATGAKLGISDRNGNGSDHGIKKETVIRELQKAGYRLLDQYDFVKDDMNYFLVFVPQ
jgi:cyclopropane fatty-acyl-phospholipid synthase-like methyltransferase